MAGAAPCDTLQYSHIMTGGKLLNMSLKAKETHGDETADLAAVEDDGIEFIGGSKKRDT